MLPFPEEGKPGMEGSYEPSAYPIFHPRATLKVHHDRNAWVGLFYPDQFQACR